jgi:hypothetical protein
MRVLALVAVAACGRLDFGANTNASGNGNGTTDAPAQWPDGAAAPIDAAVAGLVAYWPMDQFIPGQPSGGRFVDVIGAHDAMCTTCPTVTTGVVDNAAVFDGQTSCLTVPTLGGWVDSSFTISAWVQSTNRNGPIVVHESSNGCPSPELSLTNGVGLTQLNTSNSTHNFAWTLSGIAANTWHHVAVTWDGTTQRVFLDGLCNCSVSPTLQPLDNTQPFTIGCYPTGGATHLWGSLDEVRVYNRTLSMSEIADLYAVSGRTATPVACNATCLPAPPPAS